MHLILRLFVLVVLVVIALAIIQHLITQLPHPFGKLALLVMAWGVLNRLR